MDAHNYGGVSESQPMKIASDWRIAEYLPRAAENMLLQYIAEFIFVIHKFWKPYMEKSNDILSEPEIIKIKNRETITFNTFLNEVLTPKLLQKVYDLSRKKPLLEEGEEDGEVQARQYIQEREKWEFPSYPGQCTAMTNIALEYTKYICEVLNLEPDLQEDVIKIRRQLLKLIRVNEYSDESKFSYPSLTLVLPDMICEFCNSLRDLDICQDEGFKTCDWVCSNCRHLYSKQEVENRLINILEKRIVAFQLQDLKCTKCFLIKNSNLLRHCSCTGTFENSMNKSKSTSKNLLKLETDIKLLISLLERVSEASKMENLLAFVRTISIKS